MIPLLVDSAVRSLAFACTVGLALRLFRLRDVEIRLAAWTAVLYGVLLMPLAGTWAPPLAVPVIRAVAQPVLTILPPVSGVPRAAGPASFHRAPHHFDWQTGVYGLYLALAALLLVRFGFGLVMTRRLRRTCRPVDDPRMLAALRGETLAAEIRVAPALVEADALTVPLTLGWMRPSILLPAAWREWDDAEIAAVLAHELSHVRRGDYATLVLSSLNRCLFWFSPLSWWLDGHLRELAEQASDDSALRATADRTHYAEVLVGFFEALHNGRGRARWQAVSMARTGRADRRIDRILADRTLSAPAKWPVLVGLAVLTLPLLYLSAAVRPAEKTTSSATLVAQATPPATPQPPTSPTRSTPPSKSLDSYVIVSGDNTTMSGSSADLGRALRFRYKIGDDYIWFRQGDKAYVIRDPATVKAAKKLFEPQADLGRRQEHLGDLQAKLGELQAKLGERQSAVRATPPDLTREIEALRQKLRSAATSEQLGDVQALLGELQAKVAEQQAKIGDQQAKLGDEQAKLGDQQAKLGDEQARLGDQQARIADEASRMLRTLIDEAFKKGLVQPEPR